MALIFYFPRKRVGGVQNLIINIAVELAGINQPVKIFDSHGGYVTQALKERQVDFVGYTVEDDVSTFRADIEDILVITTLENSCLELLENNKFLKILFWNVFPSAFEELNLIRHKLIPLLTRFFTYRLLHLFEVNNAICWMDSNGLEYANLKYKVQAVERFLPVPFNLKNDISSLPYSSSQAINISYIGRAEVWKIKPFVKLVRDLDLLSRDVNKKIVVHLITTDTAAFKESIEGKFSNIRIVYHADLHGSKLVSFLKKNINVNFSMGTSCLESASLGIPTVKMDFTRSDLPKQYQYKWLYNTTDYCLGRDLDSLGTDLTNGRSIYEILEDLDAKFEELSENSYKYVRENHSVNIIAPQLLKLSADTSLIAEDFKKYLLRFWMFKVLRRI